MKINILKLLAETGSTVSMSQGRRVVFMGGVTLNGNPVTDFTEPIDVKVGDSIQIGKRNLPVVITPEVLEKCNGSSN